ncbi:hypothetical protein [Actinomadura sp. 21ATH]|uniref:hypothetical protein n=1 Tax=Actinomadura sp. 21ATH TaxID=1735444 RepID=UPI0035BF3172
MTPIEELRAAAKALRETAAVATPGAREVAHLAGIGQCVRSIPDLRFCVTVERGEEGDAEWIALAPPVIAEPIADWLDGVADVIDGHDPDEGCECVHSDSFHQALTVAMAINGGAS